jgi:hypothetical protein
MAKPKKLLAKPTILKKATAAQATSAPISKDKTTAGDSNS